MESRQIERAILKSSDDQLDRSAFVDRLSNALVDPNTRKSSGIVVGITGPWGIGKSSILNLLNERLIVTYPEAIIVKFDPWLVSARDDIIAEFFGEFIATINSKSGASKYAREIAKNLARYGALIAPAGDYLFPGLGAIFKGALNATESALTRHTSLSAQREALVDMLRKLDTPIIILIDEMDRVEDHEIRLIAQLVRSIVDFPNISYVLAYDAKRVAQALGGSSDDSVERGRAYIEKIVQMQIPLPIVFSDEVRRIIHTELEKLSTHALLPPNYGDNDRYNDVLDILSNELNFTLRDVKRLISTYKVLRALVPHEVDWVDLLAYAALISKFPATAELLHKYPDDYIGNPVSRRAIERHRTMETRSNQDRLDSLVADVDRASGASHLIRFMFPFSNGQTFVEADYADPLRSRRVLLTTLRLDLLPGAFSRAMIENLLRDTREGVCKSLSSAMDADVIDKLLERLSDIYWRVSNPHPQIFWMGVADFTTKTDLEWMVSYSPMHEIARSFSDILIYSTEKGEFRRESAQSVFMEIYTRSAQSECETELLALWLRYHQFHYGLYGLTARERPAWFLDRATTEECTQVLAEKWIGQHENGRFLSGRWTLQPVYMLLNLGKWDQRCRDLVTSVLNDDKALDGISLMLCGSHYTTEQSTVSAILDSEAYLARVNNRLNSASSIDSTVRTALKKALGQEW